MLRFHPALGYYEKDAAGKSRKLAEMPAMLACIQGADAKAVTLHRTYLKDGAKLPAADAKKVLSAGINGAAVRLFAEGIARENLLAQLAQDDLSRCYHLYNGLLTYDFALRHRESLEQPASALPSLPPRLANGSLPV